jgi:hypothetical protein
MPGETTNYKFKYAIAVDEIKAFPAEVSQPGAEKVDAIIKERTLTIKTYAGAGTLKTGELAIQEKSNETFTLPSASTANQLIGVFAGASATGVKVTTSGGVNIAGDFFAGPTLTLANNQHVLLLSTGVGWIILAGEPKREQTYGTFLALTAAKEEEVSASRPALVIIGAEKITSAGELHVEAQVGGQTPGIIKVAKAEVGDFYSIGGFRVPAGLKYKATSSGGASALFRQILLE